MILSITLAGERAHPMAGNEMKLNIIIFLQAGLLAAAIFVAASINQFSDVMKVVGSSVAVLSHNWEAQK